MSKKRIVTAVVVSMVFGLMLAGHADAKKPEDLGKPPDDPPGPIANPALVYAATNPSKPNEPWQLYLMTADGSSTQQLTSSTLNDYKPMWKADGSQIAFMRETASGQMCSLHRIDADGTGLTLLHDFCAADEPVPNMDYVPDWSPDGTRFAYSSATGHCSPHMYMLDLTTGVLEDLTPDVSPDDERQGLNPSWSPDGGKIAYEGAPYAPWMGPRGIAVLDLATRTNAYLTPGEEARYPAWSSSGQRIAYFASGTSGNTLWTMLADGSDKTELVSVRDPARPTWSSDDLYIAFHNRILIRSGKDITFDLLRVRSDGTDLTNLTESSRVWEFSPDWNSVWENDLGD